MLNSGDKTRTAKGLRNRRVFAATITVVGLALSACSAGQTAVSNSDSEAVTEASSRTNTLVVGATSSPASLDFTTTSGAAIPQAMMGNIYEGLVRINQSGDVEPLLARSWEVSDDGKEYVFRLRENVSFSNGEPFNAASAKFSIERVQSDAWTNGLKAPMNKVTSVEALDEYTLKVTLDERSNTWLWNMGTLIGAMMTPGGVDDLATNPVGTGPYLLDKWAVGTALSFKANPHYWGDAPKSSRATLRYFGDAISLTNAVRTGDVDAAIGLQNPELIDVLDAQDDLTTMVGTTNGEVLLSMNNNRAPFDDVRVRQAVMYGVNRQAIIDAAWDGYGTDTGGEPVPPTDPWYTGTSRYDFDLDKARALMEEAGAVGKHVTISVPSTPYAQAASEMLYSQLTEIGFDVDIESNEFPAVWLAKVMQGKDYDMSLIAHVEARDIPALFGNPDYYLGFDSERVRALLADADKAPEDQYAPLMKEAVAEIMDEAAANTLFNFPNIVVTRRGVEGMPVNTVTDELRLAGITKGGS